MGNSSIDPHHSPHVEVPLADEPGCRSRSQGPNNPPRYTAALPKSVIVMMKQTNPALRMPKRAEGSVRSQNCRQGEAPHDICRLVGARIQQHQRRADDHHGLRQRIERVRDQQAPEAVYLDLDAKSAADDAIAPQQEDQPKRLNQRRREQWQHNDCPDQPLAREGAAVEPLRD